MSWEPDTSESNAKKTRDEVEKLRQDQFFNTSAMSSSSIRNSMGTSTGVGGFSFAILGDILEEVVNTTNNSLGELETLLSAYVFITPSASEASSNKSTVNKIGNGTGNTVDTANLPQNGQLLTLRPKAGTSLELKNNASTGNSYDGNLLLGSDITLTESQSITLRYQNEIKYADTNASGDKYVGGWIVHSTGNGSGSGAWVNTATSPLNMDGNAIFFDLKVNNKKFILSSGNNLDYTVDVDGGAHNFYVDDLSSAKLGITETKLESNVPLDMNLNYVEFQEISTPSTPSANHGFIYAKDVSGVTTPMWSNSAGETSLFTSSNVAWSNVTIDVNKDMNQKQLTNLNAVTSTSNVTATGFIFNTSSGNPSKITSSATSDIMGFMVNGVEKGSFAKDGALDTIFEVAGNPSPMMKFSSTATGANRVIGTIQFDGLDLATPSPSRQTYALIYGWSRNVGASSKEGELQFNVMKSNVSTGIMKMDGTGLLPHADNTSALGSASLGWSEIRSKGSVYGSQYYFVTSSGTAPRITSSANSTVMGLWVDGFESASVTYDTFGGNKDGELAINGSSAIGARFRMYNSATPSGGSTTAGRMYFDAIKNGGGGGTETFALIEAGATNYNSGSEQGEIDFQVRRGSTNTESVAIINQTGLHPPSGNSNNYNLGSMATAWNIVYGVGLVATKDNSPSQIDIYRHNSSLGNNEIGRINWYGDITGTSSNQMAFISSNVLNHTQGDGYIGFNVAVNGTTDTFFELYGDDPKVRFQKPLDLVRQAVPSDPASNATGKLFYNSTNNHLSFRKKNDANNAFETVDLESAGASGANTSLSNLSSPTAINQTLLPNIASGVIYSLGSSSAKWRNMFTEKLGFGTTAMTMPTNVGTNGQVLTTDGSSTLSWSTASGGGANNTLSNLGTTSLNANLNMNTNVITFDADADTSIYSTTDDELLFYTGASLRLKMENSRFLFSNDITMLGSSGSGTENDINIGNNSITFTDTTQKITSLADGIKYLVPSSDTHNFSVNGDTKLTISGTTITITDPISMNTVNKITNLATPTSDYDASTKKYVDDNVGGGGGGVNSSYIWTNDETNEYDEKVYLSNATMGSSSGTNSVDARLTRNQTYYIPIYFSKACTITEIGYECTISGGSGVTLRYGLYSNRTDNQNYPYQLLDGGGGSDVIYLGSSVGATRYPMSFTRTLSVPSAGLFWVAINNTNNTSSTFRVEGGDIGGVNTVGHVYNTNTTPDHFEPIQGFKESESGNFNSEADDENQSIGYGDSNNRAPVIFVRVS